MTSIEKLFDLTAYLEMRGFSTIDSDFRAHIDEWADWYKGKVDSFHKYNVYNGINFVGQMRKSLGMAKCVCEDWANLLLNEKVSISVDSAFKPVLDEVLEYNWFDVRANQLIELTFSLGTGAFVEFLDATGNVAIDYIRADKIYPLRWENGEIKECAFASVQENQGRKTIYLMICRMLNGECIIENHLFDNKSGEELGMPGIETVVNTHCPFPVFQIIKPNIVNNVDFECPMGISVFANSIDILQGTDLVYDSYCNEFSLGRKRLLIPSSMAKIELANGGGTRPIFDPKDTVYVAYESKSIDTQKPTEINMQIRAADHDAGINQQLCLLSKKVGMGDGRYRFESDGVKTATEVISEDSDLYQNKKKHEKILAGAITGMVDVIAFLCGYKQDPHTAVMFDDSIINDDNAKIDNNIKLVGAELKSKLSAVMDIFGVDKKTAQEELDQIAKESQVTGVEIDQFGEDTGSDTEEAQPDDESQKGESE